LSIVIFTCSATAQYTATDLHDFNPSQADGVDPQVNLIMDSAGNLYSATGLGGSGAEGIVYELSPASTSWTENILFNFVANDSSSAAWPTGPVVFDGHGNLYGVGQYGGSNNLGAVYELSPGASGWTQTVLYSFAGGTGDGERPSGSLIFDANGNLYGTTYQGGSNDSGTVFELSPSSGGWTEKVLYSFTGESDGSAPGGNLLLDSAGRIYGAAALGGTITSECFEGCGTIFRLTPVSGTWRFTRLFDFQGTTGGSAPGALVFDAAGDIYGAANTGGTVCKGIGCGVIFKLSPTASGGPWKEKILHAFTGQQDGEEPSGVAFDFNGNLFGTSFGGSKSNEGVVWELSPTTSGPWTFTQVFSFGKGAVGYEPNAGVIVDSKGNLYGTATGGGLYSHGTVFELSPPTATK
jgi:uncharacterized repeat protein (TIGR03803 family)